jgi:hypothetical protein
MTRRACLTAFGSLDTEGWGNKLVTIFAHHLDSFIVTLNLSLIFQIRDFGSGQILQPIQIYLSPGLPDAPFSRSGQMQ